MLELVAGEYFANFWLFHFRFVSVLGKINLMSNFKCQHTDQIHQIVHKTFRQHKKHTSVRFVVRKR